ncbi:MAG: class I SAM-dependent methyltransferase [Thermoplasmata archaeon]|nr:class I SAM-dependent methyltransferase [Thermoplasmata archaeon]
MWDRQQTRYIPHREARFEAMFDTLEARFGERFTVVDLGCGPGSLSSRLLDRFPLARVVAVDFDPVLLFLGRRTVHAGPRRLTWVEADLRDPSWRSQLPVSRADAVVSTTALHWLRPPRLRSLYRELAHLLRRGDLFLDGDHRALPTTVPELGRLAHDASRIARRRLREAAPAPSWDDWWAELEKEPELRPLFAIRRERYPGGSHHEHTATVGAHRRWLRAAGFRESAPVWQQLDDFVLAALR